MLSSACGSKSKKSYLVVARVGFAAKKATNFTNDVVFLIVWNGLLHPKPAIVRAPDP